MSFCCCSLPGAELHFFSRLHSPGGLSNIGIIYVRYARLLKRVLIDNVMVAYVPSLGNAFGVSQLGQDPLRVGVPFPYSWLL